MRRHPIRAFHFSRNRFGIGLLLCLVGMSLAATSLLPDHKRARHGPTLSFRELDRSPRIAASGRLDVSAVSATVATAAPVANAPTFGNPVISGIGGFGYEQNLRLDPTDPTRIYTSVPGSAAANTSWIWHSLDTGKTFKWVPAATPLEGKVTTCNGGGDTELGVDSAGHLYFNDLAGLVNFSVSRSDDHGVTFTCNNIGVPDAGVDRQWYAI